MARGRVLAVALLTLLPALAGAQDGPLRIGYVTTQFGTDAAAFEPLTRYLSSFLDGHPFEVVPLDSVGHMVNAADRGRLDFVVASSVGVVTLIAKHRVRPIATITLASGSELYPWPRARSSWPTGEATYGGWRTYAASASWRSRVRDRRPPRRRVRRARSRVGR